MTEKLAAEERARRVEFLNAVRDVCERFGLQIVSRDIPWIARLAPDEETDPVFLTNHIDSELV